LMIFRSPIVNLIGCVTPVVKKILVPLSFAGIAKIPTQNNSL